MSSIPLVALHVAQTENPVDQYAKAMSIKSLMGNQQMQQVQINQAQQAAKDQKATTDALMNLKPGDYENLPSIILKNGGSSNAVFAAQQHILAQREAKNKMDTDALALENKKNDIMLGKLKYVSDGPDEGIADRLTATAQELSQKGLLDPQHLQIVQQMAGQPAEKIRQALNLFSKSYMGDTEQNTRAMKEREVAAQELRARNTGGPVMGAFNYLTGQVPPPAGVPPPDQAQQEPQSQPQAVAPEQAIPAAGGGGIPAMNPNSLAARSGVQVDPQSGKAIRPNAVSAPAVAPMSPVDAYARIKQIETEEKTPALGADKVKQLNDALTSRWQILHPNIALPPFFQVGNNATQKDYDRIDKSLEQHERAVGTKAQQDTVNAIRNQTASLAQQAALDRHATLGMQAVVGTDAEGNRVLVAKSDAEKMGLSGLTKADADLQNKAEAARHWLTLADKKGETPESMGIMQLIDKMDKEGKLGTIASRWNDFMAGKVGAGDPEFTALRAKMGLGNTKLMQAHVGSRGGAFMLEHFEDLANAKKMDAKTLKAGVGSELDYMQDVAMLPKGQRAKSGGAQPGETVMMRAPNGQTKPVPKDQVDHYKSLGAVPVTK